MDTKLRAEGQTITLELEARPAAWEIGADHVVAGYGYNGQVPGPVIEARVGDTLVVGLTNALSQPTTVHWHGLRVPAAMDGTQSVQHPVQPGARFEYRFRLPDAGTFWYHPHANETEQLERGLYGAIVVRDPRDPIFDRERVLVLDDVKLDRKGEVAPFGGRRERHDGRRGDTFLVNGRSDHEIEMGAGQTERWRIVNASSSRYVLLSLGGRAFRIVGSDGGLLEAPVGATEVLLTPGDRSDLAVGPFAEGDTFRVVSLPYSRGMVREDGGVYAQVRVSAGPPSVARIPPTLRSIPPLVDGPVAPSREIHLEGRMSLRRGVDWSIDGEAHHHAPPVPVGRLQVWDVVNDTRMDHPFHLHGFFFQVLEVNGEVPAFLSWEDTVNIPAGGRVRLAWLPDDRPGSWMYHCHILEHHAAGMMAHFEVVR